MNPVAFLCYQPAKLTCYPGQFCCNFFCIAPAHVCFSVLFYSAVSGHSYVLSSGKLCEFLTDEKHLSAL
ncbi:MAG TPA: hypothetical protein DCM31_09885 [Deferribacteraceae bacterium]|nr:hypothetical protein [Deferribacteraceae bacterium]